MTRRAVAAAFLVLAVVLALSAPPLAAAGATVAGSEYAVTFDGTGRARLAEEWGEGEHAELKGSWSIADSPVDLWLPSQADPEEEMGVNEYGFTGGGSTGVPRPDEPASLTSTGYSEETTFSCTSDTTKDGYGYYSVYAETVLGAMQVSTAYQNRTFTPGETSSGVSGWQCDPADRGFGGLEEYPPPARVFEGAAPPGSSATYKGDGGRIAYSATVPFADVGEQSFTLPVTDDSTVSRAPWWGEWEQLEAEWYAYEGAAGKSPTFSSHDFSIEGSYEFQKLCDGTIVFTEGNAEGSCGTAAGATGSPIPPSPAPPRSPPASGPKPKKHQHGCRKGFKKKKVHGKPRCVKKAPKHKRHGKKGHRGR